MTATLKPWGSYTNLLDEEYTKVKKIVVSLVKHQVINITSKEVRFGLLLKELLKLKLMILFTTI